MAMPIEDVRARTLNDKDLDEYAMRIATRAQETAEAADRRIIGFFGPNFRDHVIREAAYILKELIRHDRVMQVMKTDARRFTMYRRNVPDATHDANQKNAPDQPQFEGVQFSDGTVAIRWLTAKRSTAVWASMDDAMAIHGHPEYGSELVWHDASIDDLKSKPE